MAEIGGRKRDTECKHNPFFHDFRWWEERKKEKENWKEEKAGLVFVLGVGECPRLTFKHSSPGFYIFSFILCLLEKEGPGKKRTWTLIGSDRQQTNSQITRKNWEPRWDAHEEATANNINHEFVTRRQPSSNGTNLSAHALSALFSRPIKINKYFQKYLVRHTKQGRPFFIFENTGNSIGRASLACTLYIFSLDLLTIIFPPSDPFSAIVSHPNTIPVYIWWGSRYVEETF